MHHTSRPVDDHEQTKVERDKTQLIWLGTRQQLAKLTVTQLQMTTSVVEFDSVVTDLGVVLPYLTGPRVRKCLPLPDRVFTRCVSYASPNDV